ncbi:hypothetical protein ACTWP6_16340 [Mycobacterium sp. 4D054]|uniref:hypothetical protein n=1 Tax=Mycobacterium sp. 4D054 TaxID=3457440 RepID=UPI003FD23FBE
MELKSRRGWRHGTKPTIPDQVRLRAYLDDTEALVATSRIDGRPALRLDVGLPSSRDLLVAGDLDNYAYPLAYRRRDPKPPTSALGATS